MFTFEQKEYNSRGRAVSEARTIRKNSIKASKQILESWEKCNDEATSERLSNVFSFSLSSCSSSSSSMTASVPPNLLYEFSRYDVSPSTPPTGFTPREEAVQRTSALSQSLKAMSMEETDASRDIHRMSNSCINNEDIRQKNDEGTGKQQPGNNSPLKQSKDEPPPKNDSQPKSDSQPKTTGMFSKIKAFTSTLTAKLKSERVEAKEIETTRVEEVASVNESKSIIVMCKDTERTTVISRNCSSESFASSSSSDSDDDSSDLSSPRGKSNVDLSPTDLPSGFYTTVAKVKESCYSIDKQEALLLALISEYKIMDAIPALIRAGYLREDCLTRMGREKDIQQLQSLFELIGVERNKKEGNPAISFAGDSNVPNPYAAISSRFLTDFLNHTRIGKGGFGSVYRVSHRIDGKEYAVKRIRFCFQNLGQFNEEYEKVVREVHALSSIQDHPSIVRYHNAWFETISDDYENDASDDDSLTSASDSRYLSTDQVPAIDYSGNSNYIDSSNNYNNLHGNRVWKSSSGRYTESDSSGIFEMDSDDDMESPQIIVERCGTHDPFTFDKNDMFLHTGLDKMKSNTHTYQKDFSRDDDASSNSRSSNISYNSSDKESDSAVNSMESPKDFSFKTKFMERLPTPKSKAVYTSNEHVQENLIVFRNGSPTRVNQTYLLEQLKSSFRNGKFHMILCIQMQLCSNVTLQNWLESKERQENRFVDLEKIFSILLPIVDAVCYIHHMGYIHRDIKPSNVFFSKDNRPILGDFGLAKSLMQLSVVRRPHNGKGHNNTQYVGTQLYAAPEQINGEEYDEKVDIFSIGIMIFELFYPFSTGSERIAVLTNLRKGIIPDDFNERFRIIEPLIRKCLCQQPHQRPSADELLSELQIIAEKLLQPSNSNIPTSLSYPMHFHSTIQSHTSHTSHTMIQTRRRSTMIHTSGAIQSNTTMHVGASLSVSPANISALHPPLPSMSSSASSSSTALSKAIADEKDQRIKELEEELRWYRSHFPRDLPTASV